MPAEKQIFTLLQVTKSVQKTIDDRYGSKYWIKAEMNKLNYYQHSGHCYPDLVEKVDGKVVAQIRSNLWKDDYNRINQNFQKVLKEPLKDGIKILFLASISFHPVYGLSLRVIDIDPSFTLGDLEKEKQDTIKKLQAEGIYNQNKQLKLPLLPQRIAVISVESSKGYADFIDIFESAERQWNYKFFQMLFPSILQGDNAAAAMIKQLQRIKKVKAHFDLVVIVRGGGGDVGLTCYNDYHLAREIALFPIPVLSGIGHSTNETVAEMIAFENAITPTKLAEFLIQTFHNFSVPVQNAKEKITDLAQRTLDEEKAKFSAEVKMLRSVTQNILNENKGRLRQQLQSVSQHVQFGLRSAKESLSLASADINRASNQYYIVERQKIAQLIGSIKKDVPRQLTHHEIILASAEKNLHNLSPSAVLKRGYSITTLNGKSVKAADQLKEGEELLTMLHEGSVISKVEKINKTSENE